MAPSGTPEGRAKRELSAKPTEGECRTDFLYASSSVQNSFEPFAGLPQSPPAAEPAPSRREPLALLFI